jgi:aminobenzoyl-glutamate transport protein
VLNGEDGSYKPFFDSIVPLVSLLFGLAGLVYGRRSGSIRDLRGAVAACSAAMGTMGGYLVLSFVAAQVVAWFSWSNLGLVLAVRGADLLKQADLPRAALLVAFILFTALLDLLIVSASAKWAILAPVFVPMLGLLQISPALAQAAYRIGDSPFNVISPLLPYLPVVLTVARRYNPETGMGTLLAAMMPYALVFLPVWTAFLLFWVELGLPLGP